MYILQARYFENKKSKAHLNIWNTESRRSADALTLEKLEEMLERVNTNSPNGALNEWWVHLLI